MMTRKEFKEEVKREREYYREHVKQLKAEYKGVKPIKKATEKRPVLGRIEYTVDSLTLKVCEPFERKAADIRFKRFNPPAYAARMFIRDVTPVISYLHKKSVKKTLGEREQGLLIKLDTKLMELADAGLAEDPAALQALRALISQALPSAVTEQLDQAEQVMGMFKDFVQKLGNNQSNQAIGMDVLRPLPEGCEC